VFEKDETLSTIWSGFKRNKLPRFDNGRLWRPIFNKLKSEKSYKRPGCTLDILKELRKQDLPIKRPLKVGTIPSIFLLIRTHYLPGQVKKTDIADKR